MSPNILSIESIIETLLHKHECVVLPGFGGFIVRDSPCNFNANKDQIKPFARHIFFNPHLKENDGLLVAEIQKIEDLSYSEAMTKCSQSIELLKSNIIDSGSVVFGELGSFFKGQEHIWFAPSSTLNLSLDSYGLMPVDVKRVHVELENTFEVPKNKEKKHKELVLADNKDIEKIEYKKPGYKAWLIAASIALLVHFVYLNVENMTDKDNEASILPDVAVILDSSAQPDDTQSINAEEFIDDSVLIEPESEKEAAFVEPEIIETPKITDSEILENQVEPQMPEIDQSVVLNNEEQFNPISEKKVAKYMLEINAHYHVKDLQKTGRNARVEQNGIWYEVISNDTGMQ